MKSTEPVKFAAKCLTIAKYNNYKMNKNRGNREKPRRNSDLSSYISSRVGGRGGTVPVNGTSTILQKGKRDRIEMFV